MTAKIKWLVAILVVSLTANIFVAGMMLGKGFRDGPRMRGGDPVVGFNIKRFGKYLSKDERKKIRKILHSQRGELGGRFREVKISERHIKQLIAAKEVDREALLAALKSHAALMQKMHEPMQRVMMEVIAELDFETRSKMAENMFKHGGRRGIHGNGHPPFGGGPEGRRSPPRHGDDPPHHGDDKGSNDKGSGERPPRGHNSSSPESIPPSEEKEDGDGI